MTYGLLVLFKLQIRTTLSSDKMINTKGKSGNKMNSKQNNIYVKTNTNPVVFVDRL